MSEWTLYSSERASSVVVLFSSNSVLVHNDEMFLFSVKLQQQDARVTAAASRSTNGIDYLRTTRTTTAQESLWTGSYSPRVVYVDATLDIHKLTVHVDLWSSMDQEIMIAASSSTA